MKQKIIITSLVLMFLIGTAMAGIISGTITLTAEDTATIKAKTGVRDIAPVLDKVCSSKECRVTINQKDLLNNNVIIIDKYKYNCSVVFDTRTITKIINDTEPGTTREITLEIKINPHEVCISKLKTDDEINSEAKAITEEMLKRYAEAIRIRTAREEEMN
jgi:hypothetical protein